MGDATTSTTTTTTLTTSTRTTTTTTTTTTTVFLGPRKSNLATEGNLKPVMVAYIFLDDGIASQTRIAGALDSKGGDRLFTTYFAASLAVSRSEGRQASRSPEMLENDKRFMSLLFDLHKL